MIATTFPLCTFAVVAVPSPAAIVDEATVIVDGQFQVSTDGLRFRIGEVLKGDLVPNLVIKVAYPSDEQDLGGMIDQTITSAGDDPVILFGVMEGDDTILLRWLFASVWPQGHTFATFPNSTFAQSQDFVRAVMDYQMLAQTPEKLVSVILRDLSGARVYAALDFLDVGLDIYMEPNTGPLKKALVWLAFAQILTNGQDKDSAVQQKILSMVPMLPASLVIPYLISLASQTVKESLRVQYISGAGAVLMSRGLIEPSQMSDFGAIIVAFEKSKNKFRAADAAFAIELLDKPCLAFPEGSVDKLLELITEEKVSGDNPEDRKAEWKQIVAKADW